MRATWKRAAKPAWCWASRWPVPAPAREVWRRAARRSNWLKLPATPPSEADALLASAEAALAAGNRAEAAGYAGRARESFESAKRPESLWRACVLLLRSGTPDRAVAAEATAALGQLKASWPAEDFRSYLNRPVIRRLHGELLRANPAAPTID